MDATQPTRWSQPQNVCEPINKSKILSNWNLGLLILYGNRNSWLLPYGESWKFNLDMLSILYSNNYEIAGLKFLVVLLYLQDKPVWNIRSRSHWTTLFLNVACSFIPFAWNALSFFCPQLALGLSLAVDVPVDVPKRLPKIGTGGMTQAQTPEFNP